MRPLIDKPSFRDLAADGKPSCAPPAKQRFITPSDAGLILTVCGTIIVGLMLALFIFEKMNPTFLMEPAPIARAATRSIREQKIVILERGNIPIEYTFEGDHLVKIRTEQGQVGAGERR